jgi:hypothetical protein
MVLPLDDSTNDEDDDKGEAGIADGAGGDWERCGMGAWEPTGSNGNTGLGVRVDCWGDRDAWVDMGLEDLLRVREHTACTRRVMKRTSLTKLGWACHESAGTSLRTHAIGQDSGLEESRTTIRT